MELLNPGRGTGGLRGHYCELHLTVRLPTVGNYVCLDLKFLHQKISNRIFGQMHGVLNEVYLQNFLHGWVINYETNLMSLLNP